MSHGSPVISTSVPSVAQVAQDMGTGSRQLRGMAKGGRASPRVHVQVNSRGLSHQCVLVDCRLQHRCT